MSERFPSAIMDTTLLCIGANQTVGILVSGWKVGWVIGHKDLTLQVMVCNQRVQYTVATPLQKAVAIMFSRASKPYKGYDTYYAWLQESTSRNGACMVRGAFPCTCSPP